MTYKKVESKNRMQNKCACNCIKCSMSIHCGNDLNSCFRNKPKHFSTPKPIYSRGEVKESKSNRVKTSKGEANPIVVLPRPKFNPHECKREDDCQVCRDYVNFIDIWRHRNDLH